MGHDVIDERHCSSANEFLQAISPHGKLQGNEDPQCCKWVFRGHSNDSYQLLPTALRPNECQGLHKLAKTPAELASLKYVQVFAEATLLVTFMNAVNDAGLRLPGYTRATHSQLLDNLESLNNLAGSSQRQLTPWYWPSPEFDEMIALARHYSVPTRFLDWSYSPKIAAYFAAAEAASDKKCGCNQHEEHASQDEAEARLSVWGLRRGSLQCLGVREPSTGHVITGASTASNPNLFAQRGCFTVNRVKILRDDQMVDNTPLDKVLTQAGPADDKLPCMAHFTMPISEAGKLLWLLAKDGITGNRMFPNYDGAMKLIEEEQFYVNPSSP